MTNVQINEAQASDNRMILTRMCFYAIMKGSHTQPIEVVMQRILIAFVFVCTVIFGTAVQATEVPACETGEFEAAEVDDAPFGTFLAYVENCLKSTEQQAKRARAKLADVLEELLERQTWLKNLRTSEPQTEQVLQVVKLRIASAEADVTRLLKAEDLLLTALRRLDERIEGYRTVLCLDMNRREQYSCTD